MRFSILAATAAGALLTLVGASPSSADEQARVCVPALCMGLAVIHSDCVDPMSPDPVAPIDANPKSAAAQCVCADEELRKAYLSCYGFCDVDEATEPFCGMPVERDVEEASPSQVEIAHAEITAAAEFNDSPEMHEKRDAEPKGSTLRNFINFCGVPGQACGEKMVETDTVTAERRESTVSADRRESTISARRRRTTTTTAAHSEITPAPEAVQVEERDAEPEAGRTLPNFMNFCGVHGQACGKFAVPTTVPAVEERDAEPTAGRTLRNFINFCGVPGQACGKFAVPTAAPGSDFEDVGHVEDEELEGKVGHGAKRDEGHHVPTTLETVKGRPVAPSRVVA